MKIAQTVTTISTKVVQVDFSVIEVRELLTRAAQGMMEEDVTLSEFSIQFQINPDGSAHLQAVKETRES